MANKNSLVPLQTLQKYFGYGIDNKKAVCYGEGKDGERLLPV